MEAVPMESSFFSSPLLYPLLTIVTVLFALYYYTESTRLVKLGKKLPGPPTVPFLGNALIAVNVKPKDVLSKILELDIYGNVVRAFLGPKLVVFLSDPRDVELILGSHVHIDKSPEYRFFKPWLGEGLLISTGEKWRTHRKIIAPAFHLNVLRSFVPYFYENSRDLVMRLKKEAGNEFDVHDYMSSITVDILLETAMGLRGENKEKSGFDYAMAVMKLCQIIHQRHYDVLLRLDALFQFTNFAKQEVKLLNTIHGLTSRVIRKRKAEYAAKGQLSLAEKEKQKEEELKKIIENVKADEKKSTYTNLHYVRDDLDEIDENDVGEKKRLAFLDCLLEVSRGDGPKLSEAEVEEEVNTIMFEGHDTTASGSSFALCVLAARQDIQDKVYEEINEIFNGSDRPCTFQDTIEMKYLERVILETLRLYPPVPAIARQLNQDVKLASGDYTVPKGCTVVIAQYKIHRLEEYYPNPEEFNPDNFLPEKMQNRHYYSYIPFSAGPRSCVGRKFAMLKLKVLLSTILRNYKIKSNFSEKDFKLQVDIILKRSDGFKVSLEPRVKASA
ncbi:cytochrome P450 4g15-like [Leptopilina heterotoma]|uniref:cytochrome P450 4g15-like n=1 Tax=Leptopilina heterotoma TaxID=63436 RepID=UPI001CA7CE22|nr:cytochrome P450 4g15-like [Leptopilina heterotoma]